MNIELIAITVVLVLLLSVVLHTLLVGISPMPSTARARGVILDMLDHSSARSIVELGSGWGNLLVPIARRYPDKAIRAYELSPFPYLVSVFLKWVFRLGNVQLYRRNFLRVDLSEADVLVCYLYPRGMQRLRAKIQAEGLSPIVISNTFAFNNIEPQQVVRLNDLYNSPVYLYNMGN